jgi:transcriptional regulator GlxA family with amidase domain
MLDRYFANLSVEVEPFALCLLQSGWRLTLPGPPVLQGAIMTQLMIHMLRAVSSQSDSNLEWLGALNDPRLARAIDQIMEDPFAPHTVESLAESANMLASSPLPVERIGKRCGFSSRSHFSHAFKKHTELSPAEFRSQ